MTDWKLSAANAVKALQQWYGANSSGLYTWNGSDQEVEKELNISDALAQVTKTAGFGFWDTLRDMLRWWNTANAITALIDYMLVTNDHTYNAVIDNTFTNGPSAWHAKPGYNAGDVTQAITNATLAAAGGGDARKAFLSALVIFNANFLNNFYDDEGWWALAWIKAYDLTGDHKYIAQAETIFNDMTSGWDNVCNGGIYWQKNQEDSSGNKPYKNAIANELFLAVSASLYVRTKDQNHLNLATKELAWFQNSKLINSAHLINDSLNTSCNNDGSTDVWTYNQGVILGALSELFLSTGQKQLLDTAVHIADALIAQPVVSAAHGPSISGVNNGILTEYNDNVANAGVDTKQFKGIFIRNLGYLYKHRPLARYRAFILKNAASALAHMKSIK